MSADVVSMGCEMASPHFIDEDQTELQLERCKAHTCAEKSYGGQAVEARRILEQARMLLRHGLFTGALFLALRAQGIVLERVA